MVNLEALIDLCHLLRQSLVVFDVIPCNIPWLTKHQTKQKTMVKETQGLRVKSPLNQNDVDPSPCDGIAKVNRVDHQLAKSIIG